MSGILGVEAAYILIPLWGIFIAIILDGLIPNYQLEHIKNLLKTLISKKR